MRTADARGTLAPMQEVSHMNIAQTRARHVLLTLALLFTAIAAAVPAAAADEVPGRTITVVVPAQAGGTIDLVGRVIGDVLAAGLEQPVVIENRVGAGTIIGSQHVARATADGNTLLVGVSIALVTAPSLYPKVGLLPERDLLPVTRVLSMPNVIVWCAATRRADRSLTS
jgi:tripartite-type tricarboxylate transporter receptor subunit TctC